jgi:hypothetical protein
MNIDWKSHAELIGILALVVSLVFVGLELRQARSIAHAEMNAGTLANRIEESSLIIGNVDVWIRGNANEQLTLREEAIYTELVKNINDRFWFNIEQQKRLGTYGGGDLDVAEFAGFLYENPGALRVWRAREERLAHYREKIRPDETLTSDWIIAVDSALATYK